MTTLLLFTIIMYLSMTISGVIGFAGNVIALPLLSLILDLPTAVAVLALCSFIQTVIQSVQNRMYIHWQESLKIILLSCLSMPIGLFFLRYFPEAVSKLLLGVFVLIIALQPMIQNLLRSHRANTSTAHPWDWLYLIIGGIFSGAFASGGPLIVIYCTHRLSDKNIFRGTMFFSGCFSMGLVALEHFFQHHYTADTMLLTGIALVVMVAAIYTSTWIAGKVDTQRFHTLVNLALVFAGAMLVLQNTAALL